MVSRYKATCIVAIISLPYQVFDKVKVFCLIPTGEIHFLGLEMG